MNGDQPTTFADVCEVYGLLKPEKGTNHPILVRYAKMAETFPIANRPHITYNQAVVLYSLREKPELMREWAKKAENMGKPALEKALIKEGLKNPPATKTTGPRTANPAGSLVDTATTGTVTNANGSKATDVAPTVGKGFRLISLDAAHYNQVEAVAKENGVDESTMLRKILDEWAAIKARRQEARDKAVTGVNNGSRVVKDDDEANRQAEAFALAQANQAAKGNRVRPSAVQRQAMANAI